MLNRRPDILKTDVEYLMQIIAAMSKWVEKGISRYKYLFFVRVWPDKNNLDDFYDLLQRFNGVGKDAKKLVTFVEGATGYEFDISETDVEFTEGAVFKGVIKKEHVPGALVSDRFYNIEVVKHCGYCDIEGGIGYDMSKIIEYHRKK